MSNSMAYKLSEITSALDAAVNAGDLGAIGNCVAKLRDLRLTLDADEGGGDRDSTETPLPAHQLANMLAELMWCDNECLSDYRAEWGSLTPELKQECLRQLSLDLECQFFRLGDPYRGCSPLEYLADKFAEQETLRKEEEARKNMSEEEKQKRQQAADYLRDDSPGPSAGMNPAEYVAKCMEERKRRCEEVRKLFVKSEE